MKLIGTTAVAAVLATAFPALALDFGKGFTLTGDVELEYLTDASGDDSSNAFSDVTLGWRSQADRALGFGVDVTFFDTIDLTSGESVSAIWGGLVLTTGFGELTVGNPRALLSTMVDSPSLGGLRIYDFQLQGLVGSTLELLDLQIDEDFYGASFKGTAGALTYGVSYHTVDADISVDIYEIAATYQLGNTLIQAGAESMDIGPQAIDKQMLGATYVADRWSAGVLVTSFKQTGVKAKTVKLFGDYKITDAFTIGVQALNIAVGGQSDTIYGVNGEYGFGSGGFAQLGAIDASGGGDAIYQASIGYRF